MIAALYWSAIVIAVLSTLVTIGKPSKDATDSIGALIAVLLNGVIIAALIHALVTR